MPGRKSRIEVKVNERERAAIRARARRSGMTVSGYIRSLAEGGDEVPVIEIDADGLRRAYASLKRTASNVNQIARALNTHGGNALPPAAIETALASVATAADSLAEALQGARRKRPIEEDSDE